MVVIGGFGGGGSTEFEYKHIVWALMVIILMPILLPMMVPPVYGAADWEDEVKDIENTYYRQTGVGATSEINVWTLTGIYTPYTGGNHGYTDDGWLYGDLITSNTPYQYSSNNYWSGETFTVARNPDNGLYYYTSKPTNSPDIVEAAGVDYDGATVYSAVTMDVSHKSDIFFSSGGKTTEGDNYYYAYSGYRYSFSPLSNYETTVDGTTYEIEARTSSLSLVWYEYQDIDGICGQMAISSKDIGVSYLDAEDVIRAYNSTTYSARFDMMFGNLPMHLVIRLNPYAVASGLSIPDIWNGGYWSVMVYSDQDAQSATFSQTWEFSPTKILDTVIALFSFDVASQYQLTGWEATLASAVFSLAMYSALIAIALNHAYLWILVAAVAALQGLKFW